jgi:hypothetical protein
MASPTETSVTDVVPAGAITALVAQMTAPYSGSSPDDDINPKTVGAIITAAATTAGQKYWIAIAEAAAQAYVTVSGIDPTTFTGIANGGTSGVDSILNTSTVNSATNGANIVHAIITSQAFSAAQATAKTDWIALLQQAVSYGAHQVVVSATGIGAKGILDYAHASGTGPYVTSIFDL